MGVVCRATSNSNSRGVGDEETEELIVDDGGGELASLVFRHSRASANPKLFQSRGQSTLVGIHFKISPYQVLG